MRAKTRLRLIPGDLTRLAFVRRAAGLPLPPTSLMAMVMGTWRPVEMPFRYARNGRAAAQEIRALLSVNGFDMQAFGSILDFGCGCGRVIRHWRARPGRVVVGTDYNPDLIRWCEKNLPHTFHTNDAEPPLRYDDESFEFIYALSVFTHLAEREQMLWRDELLRVLRPGGLFLFTTQGSRFRRLLDASQQELFDEGNIVYEGEAVASVGENRFGSYQSEAHVRNVLAEPMQVVDFKPWAAMGVGGQDLWLTRKPTSA